MAGSTATTFSAFMKDYYDSGAPARAVAAEDPFLSKLMTDVKTISGKAWIIPVLDREAQGLGTTRALAQTGAALGANGGNVGGAQWSIAAGDYKGSVYIGDKVMKLSASDIGAFLEDKKEEVDSLHREFAHTMASYCLRDGGHSLCSFTESGGTCTLVAGTESDIVNIAVGQQLLPSANDGTTSSDIIISAAGIGYVISVDYNAGTFVVSATATGTAGTPNAWTGTMYAFRSGDFGGTGFTRILLGYGAWCPVAAPSAVAFESVVRTTNAAARGGIRMLAAEVAGFGTAQRIKTLVTRMNSRGYGSPSDLYLHTEKWQGLADEMESRGIRPLDGKIATFGFPKLQLATTGGLLDIWPSRYMPIDACYAPNFDVVKLATPTGKAGFPEVLKGDTLEMLRAAADDYYEHRIVCYPAYAHRLPGKCGRTPV